MNSVTIHYIILVVITILVVVVLSYFSRRVLDFLIRRNSDELHEDPTNFIFLKNSISFILYSIGFFWIIYNIPYLKSLGAALFAGAGVLAAIIGFASQKAFSNVIGGLFILIFKPFRVGDVIEISSGAFGTVEEITLRHTVIKDYEFRRVIIPNHRISDDTIVNSSIVDEKIRKYIDFDISYESSIDKAFEIIKQEISQHPLNIDNRSRKEIEEGAEVIETRVIELGDYSVKIRAFAWTRNFLDAFHLTCDVLKSTKESFDANGIEIPYPHRTIINKQSKDVIAE